MSAPSSASSRRDRSLLGGVLVAFAAIAILGGLLYIARPKDSAAAHAMPAFFDPAITLAQARTRAAAEHKPVFILATADWCGPCKVYKAAALSDPRIAQWVTASAIPVYLDVDAHPQDAAALQITSIPDTIILSPTGEILDRKVGIIDANTLLARLNEIPSR